MAFSQEYPEETNDLVVWAKGRLGEWDAHYGEWTEEAITAYGMVANDQWSGDDKAQMEEDDRPMFSFNRIAGFIRGVCGLEISNRQEVKYIARELNDTPANEIFNSAAKWVRENCDAEDEESEAFKDMLTCGIGWTETHLTKEYDPDGDVFIERIDPLSMRHDPSARKRGLKDTKWRARLKWLPISEIEDRWGRAIADQVRSDTETDAEVLHELFSTPHDATRADEYATNASPARTKRGVPVVQFQYFKNATFYRVRGPDGGPQDVPEERYKKLLQLIPDGTEIRAEKFRKRVYRQLIYSGVTKFEDEQLPSDDFSFQAITGVRDRNKGTWYGFARDLLDPQRWVNKFFSSMADIVASQAKGGLLAESEAFLNKERAQDEWANPRSILWLKRDGLNKIKERVSAGIPSGVAQLLEFTVASLPHVAGVNLEFLGLAARNQPGVLETQRKQAAIATLAEFFNSLRLYRKQQGRVLLQFIDAYLTDGRLIRIVGETEAKFVPLTRQPGVHKYDVVVDEAPTSPDTKARTWEALSQILPVAMKMGLPIPPGILDFAPFPTSLVQEWKAMVGEQGNVPPEIRQQMQQMQEQLAGLTKENETLKSRKEEAMQQLQLEGMKAQQQLKIETAKAEFDARRSTRELAIKEFIAEREMAIKEAIAEREMAIKESQLRTQQTKSALDVVGTAMDMAQAQESADAGMEGQKGETSADLAAAIKSLAEAGDEQHELLLKVKEELDGLDGLEKTVDLEYTPDGEVKGAKVRQTRKRKT